MANLSNINNKFLVTTGGNVLIGQTADAGKKLYVYNTASADVALLESTQVFSTLAFKSSTNASTVTIGIDGAGNAAFENKLAAGKITFVTNGAERMQIDSSGNTTITTISNQGGLTARSSQDNVIIGIDNTATGGLPWRLQSTGGSSGLGAGKLFLKVGGTETDTNLISFITDSSGNNIKMGVGITGPTAKLHIFERTANTAVGLKLQSYSWDASLSLINDQGTWEILNDRTGLGTNGTLAFYNGGYKMALTPAGNLGIGTTSPSSGISGSATVLQINDAANNNLASLALKAGTQGSKWEMAALSANALGFFDDGTERMRITPTRVSIKAKPNSGLAYDVLISLGTGADGDIGYQTVGQLAANIDVKLLDNYQEGTWTPLIDGSTSVTGQTYSRQEGSYTRIGNMVTAWFSITLTAKGTIVGFLRVSGLPYNGSASPILKPAAVAWSNMSMTANHQLSAEQFAANPFMYLYEMDASGTKTQIQTGAITDTTFITGTLTYRV